MDRYIERNGSATPPVAPAAAPDFPKSAVPGVSSPSAVGKWWYHMIAEELRAVIEAAGLTPDHTDLTQVLQALQALGLRAASETQTGVSEIATEAEVLAGTDNARMVTPAGLLTGLLGAGGRGSSDYVVIPFRDKTTGERRDLILQWGSVTTPAPNTNVTWTFPMAFPNAVVDVQVTVGVATTSPVYKAHHSSGFGLASVTFVSDAPAGVGLRVFAIGN